jgi:predicted Zn-dependent protease
MTASTKSREKTTVQLNIGLLLVTLLVLVLVGGGLYLWYRYAQTRIASQFFDRAQTQLAEAVDKEKEAVDKEKEAVDLEKRAGVAVEKDESSPAELRESAGKLRVSATNELWQYIRLRPEDQAAWIELANVYGQLPPANRNPLRALELFRGAIVRATGDQEWPLRIRLAELLIESGEFAEAETECRQIVAASQTNSNLPATIANRGWRCLAISLARQILGDGPERMKDKLKELNADESYVFSTAREKNPDDWELATTVAELYREPYGSRYLSSAQQERLKRDGVEILTLDDLADELALQTLAKHPRDSAARLAAYEYRRRFDLPAADEELKAAREIDPNNPTAQTLWGLWNLEQIPFEQRVSATDPEYVPALNDQEQAYLAAAAESLEAAEKLGVKSPQYFAGLADVRLLQRRRQEAQQLWEQAIDLLPEPNTFLYQRLITHTLANEDWETAKKRIEEWRGKTTAQARSSNTDPRALSEANRTQDFLEGLLELRQNRLEQAVTMFERVITAEGRSGPRVAQINQILGDEFSSRNSPARAAHFYERAAQLTPKDVDEKTKDAGEKINPTFIIVWRKAAQARANLGQFELARSHYERFVNDQGTPADSADWLNYARLLYEIQMQRPAQERQWLALENALNRIEQSATDDQFRDELAEGKWLWSALQLGKSPEEWTPPESITGRESAAFVQAVIKRYQEAGDQEKLQELANTIGNSRDTAVGRTLGAVQLEITKGNFDQAQALLDQGRGTADSEDDNLTLRLASAQIAMLTGKSDEAWDLFQKIVREFPNRLELYPLLANTAIDLNQISETPDWWEEKLPAAEGPQGPLQKYLASEREIQQSAKAANERVAREHLTRAEELIRAGLLAQSEWPRGLTLLGRIQDAQAQVAEAQLNNAGGDPAAVAQFLQQARQSYQQARQSYQQALELGDRSPQTLLRLSQLTEDPQEAVRILGLVGSDTIVNFDPLLNQMVGLHLATGNLDAAEQVALAATQRRPQDIAGWLSLAAVYLRQESLVKANAAAATARELASKQEATRESLMSIFQFHATAALMAGSPEGRNEQRNFAQSLIDRLVNFEPAPTQTFMRGVLLDSLDDDAATYYLRYLESEPKDTQHLEIILDFFMRNNLPGISSEDTAIRVAKLLMQLRPDSSPYKTQLARLLMARGRPEDWEQAPKLLAGSNAAAANSPAGRRTQALVLWERRNVSSDVRRKSLTTAAELLAELQTENEAEDQILLAEVCQELAELVPPEQDRQRHEKLRQMALEALGRASQSSRLNVDQLLLIALGLINLESWDQAEKTIQILSDRLQSETVPNPSPLALRISLWQGRGEAEVSERAEPLLLDFIKQLEASDARLNDLQRARLYVQIASIWDLIERPQQAIEWYQKAANLNPTMLSSLIDALVRSQQKKNALEVCQQAFQTKPSLELVELLSSILITGRTTPEEFAVAEPLLQLAREKFPNDVTVIGNLANIRSCQPDQAAAAIELYQEGLKLEPNQFVLLNNLATLYGEMPDKQTTALSLINQALKIAGEIPALLNTKARILMNQGQLNEARQLLLTIVRRDTDPRYWFHLAEVEWELFQQNQQTTQRDAAPAGTANDPERGARSAWEKALSNGIETAILTPAEVDRLETLRAELEN